MEDELGRPVTDEIKDEVRGDLHGYWTDVHKTGELLTRHKDLGFKRREDFRKTMEDKHTWLRLCEGHWKTRQLWINHFGTWRKTHMPAPPPGTPIEISDEDNTPNGPIEVSSDGDLASTSPKRRREDDGESDPGPSKKQKGKAKEVPTSNFHHARPQAKKTNAKVAKVAKVSNLHPYLSDAHQKHPARRIVLPFFVTSNKTLTHPNSSNIKIIPTVPETPPAQVRIW